MERSNACLEAYSRAILGINEAMRKYEPKEDGASYHCCKDELASTIINDTANETRETV